MIPRYQGVYAAITTPFSEDGSVDESGLGELVEILERTGISGILATGGTGESVALSQDERKRVIRLVRDRAKREIIAGVLVPGLGDAIDLAKYSRDIGADAILLLTPYYGNHTQRGIAAYYSKVTEEVDIPILIYNIPYKTGVNIEAHTIAELAQEHQNIAGIKQCSRNLTEISMLLRLAPKSFSVLAGEEDLFFPSLMLGAQGGVLASADLIPNEWLSLFRYCQEGDLEKARKLHHRILPLVQVLFSETNPTGLKIVMASEGMPAGRTREPIVPPMKEYVKSVLDAWTAFKGTRQTVDQMPSRAVVDRQSLHVKSGRPAGTARPLN